MDDMRKKRPDMSDERFIDHISNLTDLYARMHFWSRFWSRGLLTLTLAVSTVSTAVVFMSLTGIGSVPVAVSVLSGASFLLLLTSMASVVWGWDQRASDCEYAFRRLVSLKIRLRSANRRDVRRMREEFEQFGDDMPQTTPFLFPRTWKSINKNRKDRRALRMQKPEGAAADAKS
ncbi:hypothetical protein GCM10027403_27340 [Arthrobacter tecti]